MSKITKTVTYEIEPSGDCKKCESRMLDYLGRHHCLVFGDLLHKSSDKPLKQCQECKDYIAEQKRKEGKIYCKDCVYLNMYDLCENWNEVKRDDENNLYSSNCQDREEDEYISVI